jgi:hypothetical protein
MTGWRWLFIVVRPSSVPLILKPGPKTDLPMVNRTPSSPFPSPSWASSCFQASLGRRQSRSGCRLRCAISAAPHTFRSPSADERCFALHSLQEVELAQKRMQLAGRAASRPWTKARVIGLFRSWHLYVLPIAYMLYNNAIAQVITGYWLKVRTRLRPSVHRP